MPKLTVDWNLLYDKSNVLDEIKIQRLPNFLHLMRGNKQSHSRMLASLRILPRLRLPSSAGITRVVVTTNLSATLTTQSSLTGYQFECVKPLPRLPVFPLLCSSMRADVITGAETHQCACC